MLLKRALTASLVAGAIATTGATAIAPAAIANVQVGASGWQWGNPLPQGNTLRAASFAGATGYAVGDFGTLLKTIDGGATWSGLPVGTFQGLTIVQAVDADTVFAGGGCVARRSTDGGETFEAVAFTPVESSCRANLLGLSFLSPTLGFLLLDDGSVFTTDDGGESFAQRTAVPGTGAAGGGTAPSAIAFTSATTGTAAARDGRIYRTTDAGVSWSLAAEAGRAVNQLWFADAEHGFAVGAGGLFLRTADGGRTWSPRDLGAGALDYSAIRCAGDRLCLLSTAAGAQLVRTTDAGETAGTVITPATDPIYAAAFASPTRVSALGANGATVLSDDAGTTFAKVGGRLSGSYSSIRASRVRGTAYATGNVGALARTTDGGSSWTRGSVPTAGALVDVSFPSRAVGYALDDGGGIFRTANGGTTWKTLGTGSTAVARAVLAPSERIVLAIGPRGLRRSTDGGETFERVAAKAVAKADLRGVVAARGGALFVWGRGTVSRSSDAGRSWTALTKPGATRRARKRLRIWQVAFSSARTGLLEDSAGHIWRTTDGGGAWTELHAVGTNRAIGMATSSDRSAYLVIPSFGGREGGYLLRTTDGGTTWQPQFVVNEQIAAAGIAAPVGGPDYLLAGSSSLLSSRSGGSAGERSRLTLSTSRTTLARPGSITVSGRLAPAGRSARVVVSAQTAGSVGWRAQTVEVAANGTFVSSWRVPRGVSRFVAQWTGDFRAAGAGSRALDVTVRAAPRRARRGGRRGRGRR
ncbi:MAG TPA: YCF48-related protein [Conexibacter sp.]|nr:YCF48-related protein [Conexibacter sp.]